MESAQLKLSLGNDYIVTLLEDNSALLPEYLKIDSIACGEEKITVVGQFKIFDFTAVLKTSVDPENDRIGIILDDISLSRPDDSLLKNIFWNFHKNAILTITTAFFGGKGNAGVSLLKKIIDKKTGVDDGSSGENGKNSIVSADGKILWFDMVALKKFLPFYLPGKITVCSISPEGIELVVG